jgi:hypothetical protein
LSCLPQALIPSLDVMWCWSVKIMLVTIEGIEEKFWIEAFGLAWIWAVSFIFRKKEKVE